MDSYVIHVFAQSLTLMHMLRSVSQIQAVL